MRLPAPTGLDGNLLASELGSILGHDVVVVFYEHDNTVEVNADESQRATVEAAVASHAPPPPPPDPDAEFRAAVEAATTIADLKAALLGIRGPGAQARRRTS